MPTLEITTMVGCPLMCGFCPQDALKGRYGAPDKYLTLDNLKTILGTVPRHVRIDFSGMAEPWANPSATDMLQYALERGHPVAIYTTLYGMEDPRRVIDLIVAHHAQITELMLHLPDDNGNMRGWKKTDAYMAALNAFLHAGIREKRIPLQAMTMDKASRVHRDLSFIGLRGNWTGVTRAGSLNTEALGDQPFEKTPRNLDPITCRSTPFYDHNVVLPNGDVLLCCMDYGKKHTLGNLLTMDYDEVFSSKEKWRVSCINGKPGFSEDSICKMCSNVNRFPVAARR